MAALLEKIKGFLFVCLLVLPCLPLSFQCTVERGNKRSTSQKGSIWITEFERDYILFFEFSGKAGTLVPE